MTDISIKLSAYLDGELDAAEARSIEAMLEADPALQAELEALIAADASAQDQFAAMLSDPVPLALAQKIKALPAGDEPVRRAARPLWGALAAGLALFVFGGMGGYMVRDRISPAGEQVVQRGWLNDIADYHAVYSGQQRHLVEVTADESDHLKKWLGTSIGVAFSIPDLSGFGLKFEGGRLLVANGRPVGQLMYRQADGTVIALCLQSSPNGDATSPPVFSEQTIKGFDFVSWKQNGAAYVVVGPGGQADLEAIAGVAAREI